MRRLREQVQAAVRSRARTVLIGPRGSGAADIAATIHVLSGGRNDGLVPLQCSLQDAESLQAAIRALSRRSGQSQTASSGTGIDSGPTILLRNVHRLPAAAQQELLGFLQFPGFELRLLATSRVSLAVFAAKGKYSSELAALLSIFELRIPPLHDRPGDVPLLAQMLVERRNAPGGRQLRFAPEAVERLVAYNWPENVDELIQAVAASCERSAGPWIVAGDLPERLRGNWQELSHPRRTPETIDLDAYLAEAERAVLANALSQAKGNKSEAARLLSIRCPRLLRRLVQLGLTSQDEEIDFQPLDGESTQETP